MIVLAIIPDTLFVLMHAQSSPRIPVASGSSAVVEPQVNNPKFAGSTLAAAGTGSNCQKSSPMLKLTFDKKVIRWA